MSRLAAQTPRIRSFLTCDAIHIDPQTRKRNLLGIYPQIIADEFPLAQPRLWVYLAFDGVDRPFQLRLRIVDRATGEAMFDQDRVCACEPLPDYQHDACTGIDGLIFQRAGCY